MMTSPNQPTPSEVQAIRDRMLLWLTPAFRKTVMAGEMGGTGLYLRAETQLIRERKAEEVETAE